jgi:hypothetical protein
MFVEPSDTVTMKGCGNSRLWPDFSDCRDCRDDETTGRGGRRMTGYLRLVNRSKLHSGNKILKQLHSGMAELIRTETALLHVSL